MIVEQRVYKLKTGTLGQYYEYYGTNGLALQQKFLGGLIGYFSTEIGTLNEVTHLWGYDSLEDRSRKRQRLAEEPAWQKYLANLPPIVVGAENKILLPAPFSPIR